MKVFYSYSHNDEKYRERLEKFLVPLRDQGKITEWHDRKILPGDSWNNEILKAMEDSDIILMLISQDFLNSEACKKEINFATEPKNRKIAVPIILKPCTWTDTKLQNIQAIPKDGKPVVQWDGEDEAWLDIVKSLQRLIDDHSKKVKSSFIDKLNKTEFVNSGKDNISLSDIFINPEVDCTTIDGNQKKKTFSFDSFVTSENKYSLILGEQLSGKTGLLNYIYITAAENGFYPLYLDGSNIKKKINFDDIMTSSLKEQYDNFNLNDYKNQKNKILLVDGYIHTISDNFITWGKNNFDFIYITIDINDQFLFFKDSKVFADFNQAALRGMNHTSRYELIKKWKNFERTNFISDEQFQNEIDNLERDVNSIILDKNIVPNTPFYILTIIQSYETFMPQDFKITSYGHCYYAIVYAQLSNIGLSQSDIDDAFNYFTLLSSFIYEKVAHNNWSLSCEEYEDFKIEYKKDYLISNGLISRLEDCSCLILTMKNNSVSFSYPFIFYYFLGKYIASNKCQQIIENLCEKIYKKDFANILIFTIHHSVDTNLLDEIELHCLVSLDNFPVISLYPEDTSFMNNLMTSIPKEIEDSRNCEERRIAIRRNQDMIDEEEHQNFLNSDTTETSDPLFIEIEKAMKIIEVLGQIIKNRSGSFKKPKVKELMYEVEKLGLRILSFFLNTLKDDEFKKWICERIDVIEKEKGNFLDKKNIEKIVERNIEIMGFLLIIGILQKTYFCLTTKKIISLQEEISKDENTVAFDFILIFFKLSYEELDYKFIEFYYDKFCKANNFWAKGILTLLVKSYLDLHHVDYNKRQKFASLFGFTYKPNKPQLKK